MEIKAKYSGRCNQCRGRIPAGSIAEWRGNGEIWHRGCWAQLRRQQAQPAASAAPAAPAAQPAAPAAQPAASVAPVAQPAAPVAPVAQPAAPVAQPADLAAVAAESNAMAQNRRQRRAAQPAPSNRPPALSREIILGAEEGATGALLGWSGQGTLSRSDILAVLDQAGLPADWAPRAKSATGHAGKAIGDLNNQGYVVRRARKGGSSSRWRARWTVAVAQAASATVGESLGRVALTVELHDESDDLRIDGDIGLARYVDARYRALRDGEIYQAGDVTAWLTRTIRDHCGATRLGVGYYVPAGAREIADRLCRALSQQWGHGWICPMLPVTTGPELRAGIARGLDDEIAGIERSLDTARQAARREKKAECSPGVAARLLRDLTDAQDRIGAYRLLCGDDLIRPIVARIGTLAETLRKIAGDAAQRFALLDLSEPVAAEQPEPVAVSPAERAADRALEERRAMQEQAVKCSAQSQGHPCVGEAGHSGGHVFDYCDETTTSEPEPEPDPLDPHPADERFGLLELD